RRDDLAQGDPVALPDQALERPGDQPGGLGPPQQAVAGLVPPPGAARAGFPATDDRDVTRGGLEDRRAAGVARPLPHRLTRPRTDRPASWRASLGPVRQARLTAQLAQHGLGAVGDDPVGAGVDAPLDVA